MADSRDPGPSQHPHPQPASPTFSQCPLLSIAVPASRKLAMCRILKPFVKHFDLLGHAVEVRDWESHLIPHSGGEDTPRVPAYSVSHDQMSSPALAVMLFLPEFGKSRADKVQTKFKKPPWHLHHSIQLRSQKTSSNVLGQQDYFSLSRKYPLWSVCTANLGSRQLRISVFVRRYSAMVEFYRLVTGSEMESSKPGFCLFSINTHLYDYNSSFYPSSSSSSSSSSPPSSSSSHLSSSSLSSPTEGVSCQLALKHCPHINPFPLADAHLTFPVADLASLSTVLHTHIRPLTSTHHLVHDPDGNPVILYDLCAAPILPNDCHYLHRQPRSTHTSQTSVKAILATTKGNLADKTSIRSESLDSGRFSDLETSYSATELDHCMARLFPNKSFAGHLP